MVEHIQVAVPAQHSQTPSAALRFWSLALPALKCLVCPACLSVLGGVFSGARFSLLADERFHGGVIAVALVADFFVLYAALKHHGSRAPFALCLAGAGLAVVGHALNEALELVGFGVLMIAAVLNLVLLRRHRATNAGCCPH